MCQPNLSVMAKESLRIAYPLGKGEEGKVTSNYCDNIEKKGLLKRLGSPSISVMCSRYGTFHSATNSIPQFHSKDIQLEDFIYCNLNEFELSKYDLPP